MPFFEGATGFGVHGGTFQDMQEQRNYTDDRSFKITGDGNTTDYAPNHSVTDNRVYDSRTVTTPEYRQPTPNNLAYMQGQPLAHPQNYPSPSAVERLQAEIQLLQLQLQSTKLQQEIAANVAGLQNQVLGNPNGPQQLYIPPQTAALPQQYASIPGPGAYLGQPQPLSGLNTAIPGYVQSSQPTTAQTFLAVPPSHIPIADLSSVNGLSITRPATVEPSSSVASSGEGIGPAVLAAQSPMTPQNVAVANAMAHMNPTPYHPPLVTSQPPAAATGPVPALPSSTIPVAVAQGGHGTGTQEQKLKKKRKSWFTKFLRKLGVKRRKQ